ncbi:MAG: hypothetical protein U9Q69_02015 [Nanoarchaeota archaeon]|nr:hypothetical protein [Nanoarchaeota archaeon]
MLSSTFYRYSQNNSFFIINNKIYRPLKENLKSENGCFCFEGEGFGIQLFEDIYLTDLAIKNPIAKFFKKRQEMITLADLVLDILDGSKIVIENKESILGQMANNDSVLISNGQLYFLDPVSDGPIKIANGRYAVSSPPNPLEIYEGAYQKSLRETMDFYENTKALKYLKEGFFLDPDKNLGFILNDESFYACTKVKPYVLYEKKNSKYYQFDEALVGVRLYLAADKVNMDRLIVVNDYKHPALPEINKPFQPICLGKYDEKKLRQKNIDEQIKEYLRKGHKALTKEYINPKLTWYSLAEAVFSDLIVEGVKFLSTSL